MKGHLEIRSRGIVYYGSLYTWENIDSYSWREDPLKPKPMLLKLFPDNPAPSLLYIRLRRSVHFLPPVRISIPPDRRQEVEAIMRRYLSEWPAAPESAPAGSASA